MTYHIGEQVQVMYNSQWIDATIVSEPKIVLAMKFYEAQFIYKEEGKAPESVIATFGQPEIRLRSEA